MRKIALATARYVFAGFLLGRLATVACGQGVTYPDDTVSPFPPAFFGIGHIEPYAASEATGVAAQGGVFHGAVGTVSAPTVKGVPSYEAIFSRGSSPFYLPGPGAILSSVVWAITPDGKTMVGESGGPTVWNAAFKHRWLGYPDEYTHGADLLAVTADGAAAVGYARAAFKQQAARWPLDGSPPTLLGLIDGFDSSLAQGISSDGEAICGRAFNSTEAITNGATERRVAIRKLFTSPWEVLEPVEGYSDSIAYGIVKTPSLTVTAGQSIDRATGRSTACYWTSGNIIELPAFDRTNTYESAVYAVSSLGNLPILVGEAGRIGAMDAVRWSGPFIPERISALLTHPYRFPVGQWRLTRATGISQDSYTMCGVGINPEGKIEGWVAVLPPILYPPRLAPISPQRAELNKPFSLQVLPLNPGAPGDKVDSFSAKGLPDGFQIDSVTGKITGTWTDILKARDYSVTVFATRAGHGTNNRTFTLTLPPPSSVKQIINGLGFLPYAKPPGETYFPTSFGLGLSGNGQVAVGYSGPSNDPRAYRWTPAEGMTQLPLFAGALFHYSNASGASADGRVIVGDATLAATEDGPGHRVAVRWEVAATASSLTSGFASSRKAATAANVTITSLGVIPPNGTSSFATDVSADGSVVVGTGSDYNPDIKGSGISQAFRWTAGTGMVGLGWLPGGFINFSTALAVSGDGSIVVGGSSSANGSEGFRWTAAEGMIGLGLPSGASFSRATGISGNKSTIIGHSGFSNRNRAFRWTATEGMIELGTLPGHNVSEANAASFDGSVIVGRSTTDFNPSRAFIWDKTNGMRDLKEVLVAGNPNLANWSLRTAESVSSDGGTVVGYGINPTGDLEGFTAFLEVKPPQLLNIATRMRVLTGDNALIGGFIITGSETKKVIIRGIGPALAGLGLQGALGDPRIELYQGNTLLAGNDNWKENQAEVEATGIPPGHELESAIVRTLSPGSYTAILSGKNGATGVGVVEVYDLAQSADSRLANISSRGFVDTGDNVMIGGLIVGGGGPVGTGQVLIRAIGPSLSALGVSGALQDPVLELFNGNGTSLALNNDWQTSQKAEIEATTIPPADHREAAILATLQGGNYTAVVRGNNNSSGIALVEAFNLQ